MPFGDDEAIRGAKNRAKAALERTGADFGVGMEGFVSDRGDFMLLAGWAAVVNKDGVVGLGSGGGMLLPGSIAARLRAGEELGPVADDVFRDSDIKSREGTIGVLTKGAVSRTKNFEQGILYALAPFVNEGLY